MIDYDLEEIYLALLDLIRVKGPHNQTHTKEEALLALGGLKFDLESKKKERIEFDREISSWSARFQINRKLYACGGKRKVNRWSSALQICSQLTTKAEAQNWLQ